VLALEAGDVLLTPLTGHHTVMPAVMLLTALTLTLWLGPIVTCFCIAKCCYNIDKGDPCCSCCGCNSSKCSPGIKDWGCSSWGCWAVLLTREAPTACCLPVGHIMPWVIAAVWLSALDTTIYVLAWVMLVAWFFISLFGCTCGSCFMDSEFAGLGEPLICSALLNYVGAGLCVWAAYLPSESRGRFFMPLLGVCLSILAFVDTSAHLATRANTWLETTTDERGEKKYTQWYKERL
ncbi:hypothetical protein KIPB_008403, partial [Kipferlia bialata]